MLLRPDLSRYRAFGLSSQVLKQPQKLVNFKDGIPKTFDFFLRLKTKCLVKRIANLQSITLHHKAYFLNGISKRSH